MIKNLMKILAATVVIAGVSTGAFWLMTHGPHYEKLAKVGPPASISGQSSPEAVMNKYYQSITKGDFQQYSEVFWGCSKEEASLAKSEYECAQSVYALYRLIIKLHGPSALQEFKDAKIGPSEEQLQFTLPPLDQNDWPTTGVTFNDAKDVAYVNMDGDKQTTFGIKKIHNDFYAVRFLMDRRNAIEAMNNISHFITVIKSCIDDTIAEVRRKPNMSGKDIKKYLIDRTHE